MNNCATTRSIQIIKQAPKKLELSYEQLQEKAKNALEGKGHIAEGINYWDFIQKNRWSLSTVLGNKDNIIHGSFSIVHNARFFSYLCKNCEGIFCLPIEAEACIFCSNKDMEKDNKRVVMGTQGRIGVKDGVDPDLYAMAVKDIQEHGTSDVGPTFEPDWKYLEDNI